MRDVGDILLTWVFVLSSILSLFLIPISIKRWPRGERCRCPGPRKRWRFFLGYRWLIFRGGCWYNLRALPEEEGGRVRCPECGTAHRISKLLKDGRRFRLGRFACATLAIAIGCAFSSPLQEGSWAKAIPSYPLVVLSTTSVGEHRTDIRREVSSRVFDGVLTGRSASLLCESLVKEFRDDDVRWNASEAEEMLQKLWPESKEALELETMAGDLQSRIVATRILRRRCRMPSDALLTACVAELQDDSGLVDWYMGMWNAKASTVYLSRWWEYSEQYVLAALDSPDAQQRFFAAIIAGYGGASSHAEEVVEILTPHLMNNRISGDSILSSPALYHLGPSAIPYLREQLLDADSQGRGILLHLIERLEYPERTLAQGLYRMPRVTSTAHDPLKLSIRHAINKY
jgi:hypothetical protein